MTDYWGRRYRAVLKGRIDEQKCYARNDGGSMPWDVVLSCFGKKVPKEPTWGERWERRLWRIKRPERVAAVEKNEDRCEPEDFFGHRNRRR